MKVYLDEDFYTETRNHLKTLRRTQKKQQSTKNQNNTEYQNMAKWSHGFLI